MEIRNCSKCRVDKTLDRYNLDHRYTPPRPKTQCKDCVNIYQRESRAKNPERYRQRYKKKRHTKKAFAIDYLGGKCLKCSGVFENCCYDFHHLDPATKEADSMTILNMREDLMVKELDKCDLLCANCHRLEHFSNG